MLSPTDSFSSSSDRELPRLIRRDLPFHQSANRFNVYNSYGHHKKSLLFIYRDDWFHIILRMNSFLMILTLMGMWTLIILLFAVIYVAIDEKLTKPGCHLGIGDEPIDFSGAFAFSLETCTTVGYTLPSSYEAFFGDCAEMQITIYFQMAVSMMFNAFIIAIFYNRIGRCEARGAQVIFSNKAVISKDEDGKVVCDVQVYDSDSKFPLVECHARLYVVHPTSRSDCVQLRVIRPNDDFGSTLLSSVPSRITHHIDIYSPLMPHKFRHRVNTVRSYGLNMREVDSYTGNREGYICPVCGDSQATFERLWMHIRYNQLIEKYSDMTSVPGSHLALGNEEDQEKPKEPTFQDLKDFWDENQMELIAVVEAIDPLTSGTFQALQSYQKDDIVFGGSFARCFTNENCVDFDLFHTVVPLNELTERGKQRADSFHSYMSNIVETPNTTTGSSIRINKKMSLNDQIKNMVADTIFEKKLSRSESNASKQTLNNSAMETRKKSNQDRRESYESYTSNIVDVPTNVKPKRKKQISLNNQLNKFFAGNAAVDNSQGIEIGLKRTESFQSYMHPPSQKSQTSSNRKKQTSLNTQSSTYNSFFTNPKEKSSVNVTNKTSQNKTEKQPNKPSSDAPPDPSDYPGLNLSIFR